MDMKSFKLWQLPGFMLCLLLGLVFFSSCDKDDDDREWARRCAMQANTLCKPIKRGMKR